MIDFPQVTLAVCLAGVPWILLVVLLVFLLSGEE